MSSLRLGSRYRPRPTPGRSRFRTDVVNGGVTVESVESAACVVDSLRPGRARRSSPRGLPVEWRRTGWPGWFPGRPHPLLAARLTGPPPTPPRPREAPPGTGSAGRSVVRPAPESFGHMPLGHPAHEASPKRAGAGWCTRRLASGRVAPHRIRRRPQRPKRDSDRVPDEGSLRTPRRSIAAPAGRRPVGHACRSFQRQGWCRLPCRNLPLAQDMAEKATGCPPGRVWVAIL
jgi:hypothetical protein